MLFEYRYFGNSAVDAGVGATGMSFAPDTSREPTYFVGKLRQKIAFRECISALHHVVVSDLRFKPKDRTEYFAWLEQQQQVDLAEVVAHRKQTRDQLAAVQAELAKLRNKRSGRRSTYFRAQKRYFDWLYKKNLDYWFVLDPVITVHPDEVFFECFSQDESSYGRVGCSYNVFQDMGEFGCGTTNVDYSSTLYDEFQKIRDYKETELTVDPRGFEVQTTGDAAYREVKIDLPESWVRGFLQVSSAMTLPGISFVLHPMDVHNFCLWLRRHKEQRSPRSIRFHLDPGQPVRATFEPWNHTMVCGRSAYTGSEAHEIRIWGRRRLHMLERLVSVARSFRVVLLGTGMPSFWIADCGDISFTLGLSGWTANDWSASGNFDLLAPRGEVDTDTATRVFDALKQDWLSTPEALSGKLGLESATVRAALQQYTQAGRVMYDLNSAVFRVRELSRDPLDMSKLRFSNEREEAASRLVDQVVHRRSRLDPYGNTVVTGAVDRQQPTVTLNPDQRITAGECGCSFHFRNKLRRGPCEHILALRLAHDRGVGTLVPLEIPPQPAAGVFRTDRSQTSRPSRSGSSSRSRSSSSDRSRSTATTPAGATSRAGQVIRLDAKRGQARGDEAQRLLALLLERHLIELAAGGETRFLEDLRAILRHRDIAVRSAYFEDLLERSRRDPRVLPPPRRDHRAVRGVGLMSRSSLSPVASATAPEYIVSIQAGEGLPCNPGGVIAVLAHRRALPHWSGLHCAYLIPHRRAAIGLVVEELSRWGTGTRRVDRPSRQKERRRPSPAPIPPLQPLPPARV